MKYWGGFAVFFVAAFSGICTNAASLLQPSSFPKTFEDLSFTQRMDVLQQGYEPWETEYDSDGRCISGCAYPGITIQDDLRRGAEQTNAAMQYVRDYGTRANVIDLTGVGTKQDITTSQPGRDSGAGANAVDLTGAGQNAPAPRCTPHNSAVPEGQRLPLGEPLTDRPKITSGYGRRIHPTTGKDSVHKGIDFSAPVGTTVYSPAAGTVAAVWTDNTCGRGMRIAHDGGFETVYCHLSQQLVPAGDNIGAGCVIGKSGNTGRSTGPHLHYGIKYNGEYINPTEMLGR